MDKCGKCGMDIESEAVRTTGSVYHAACFKCEVCKWASLHCLDHNLFFIHFHFLQLLYQVQPVRYVFLNRWSKQALLSSGWLISTRPPPHFIIIIFLLLLMVIMIIIIRITQRGLPLTVAFARWQLCRRRVRPRWGGNYICLKIVTLESHENLERNQNDFYSLFHS